MQQTWLGSSYCFDYFTIPWL